MFLRIEEQSFNNIYRSELENIFTELVADGIKEDELKDCLSASGYNYKRYHKAVCIGIDTEKNKKIFFRDRELIISIVKDQFINFYGSIMCGNVNDCFVAMIPDIEEQDQMEKNVSEIMEAAAGSRNDIDLYCGISSSTQDISKFYDSIHESLQIVRAMKIFSMHNEIKTAYQMLPIIMILDVRDRKQLYKYRNPIIEPLYVSSVAKGTGNADLANTLEMYLKYGRNAKLTAEKMYIHRNTLNMRLRKIEEILNVDLSDPEKCRELQFAIYVRKCLLLG